MEWYAAMHISILNRLGVTHESDRQTDRHDRQTDRRLDGQTDIITANAALNYVVRPKKRQAKCMSSMYRISYYGLWLPDINKD